MLRDTPHYLTVAHSPFLASWYADCAVLRIPFEEFDPATVSFTYPEILRIIDKYGLPQDWNPDGAFGPERYIEAHVWSDDPIDRYRQGFMPSNAAKLSGCASSPTTAVQ